MINKELVEQIHNKLITEFGGAHGTRDLAGLEAAIARPYATFGGASLYPAPEDKAAAVLESIVINHPFIDGNKRTAYALSRIFLLLDDFDIEASQEEKYEMVIQASRGDIRFEEIKLWIKARLIER